MPKMTIQDQLCRGLLRHGMKELPKTAKYRRFADPGTGYHFFVGRAGALRCSRVCKATVTFVVGDTARNTWFNLGSDKVADITALGF